nr:G-protein coupled receptor 135-like [Lytechinus pictus]
MTDFMNLTESVTYFGFDDVSGTDYNNSSDEGGGGGGGGGDGGYGGKPMIWVILEALIGFLGVLGNGLVLFVFFKDKSLRNLINSFIINQSIIDFTTSFVFLLICFLPKSRLDPTSLANLIFCQIWASEYVLWALFISSSLNLVSITLDRYCAIIYPAKYRSSAKKLKRRIKLISVVTWSSVSSLTATGPPSMSSTLSMAAFRVGPTRSCRESSACSSFHHICWPSGCDGVQLYPHLVQTAEASRSTCSDNFVYANLCANPFIYTMQYQQFQKGFERAFKVKIFKGLPDSADPTKTQPSAASEDRQVDVSV